MLKVRRLPDIARPLPTPADLERLVHAPYAVMVVAGRSGSGLIQAHLDGHRQVAQIPAIWKFHDFLSTRPDLLRAETEALARAFIEFPAHRALFETQLSVVVGSRIGDDGDLAIQIDHRAFAQALAAMLGIAGCADPRRMLVAIVLAYEWCLGRDIAAFRAVFHHLHHGDWLCPELLLDQYNLGGLRPLPALREALRPDLLVVSLRAPLDVIRSYPALAAAVASGSPGGAVGYSEQLMRLLPLDWLRTRVAAGSDIPTIGVCLEALKADRAGVLGRLCARMGTDPADPALAATTYYGEPWVDDNWSVARRETSTVNPALERIIGSQDEIYLMDMLCGLPEPVYPGPEPARDRNESMRLLTEAADNPPASLFQDFTITPAGRAAASSLAWDRVSYVDRFWTLHDGQRLGTLQLC